MKKKKKTRANDNTQITWCRIEDALWCMPTWLIYSTSFDYNVLCVPHACVTTSLRVPEILRLFRPFRASSFHKPTCIWRAWKHENHKKSKKQPAWIAYSRFCCYRCADPKCFFVTLAVVCIFSQIRIYPCHLCMKFRKMCTGMSSTTCIQIENGWEKSH